MKKVLITGEHSYIGTSFAEYVAADKEIAAETVSLRGEGWKERDFSAYDAVFHVAGIAHSDGGRLSEEKKRQYYAVNTDLAVAAAEKAKAEGAGQFIYMSSSIVYGASAPVGKDKFITAETPVNPQNAYGDSKVQAEKALAALESERFKVVILRPPMIYGKNSKGNYPVLAKMAQKLPFFPDIPNSRSMLYIENLCEFVRLMIVNEEHGVFFPQNAGYFSTAELVRLIARAHGKNIKLTKFFNPLVRFAGLFTGKVNKAFGSFRYDMRLSAYKENYRVVSDEESVARTERR